MTTAAEIQRRAERRFTRMRVTGRASVPRIPAGTLPPGPPLPGAVQALGLLRYRHRYVPWAHRRYGDVFTVRLPPRNRPLVVFTRPEHAKEIFAGDPAVFHAGEANAILGPVMGEHSVLLVDGEQHRRARRLLLPAFGGTALKGYADLVTEVARAEVSRWSPGEEFAALPRMNALTLEVILRVVFGVTDQERLAALRPRVNRTVDVPPYLLLGWVWPWLRRLGPWRAMAQNQRELDRLIYDQIAEHRLAPDLDRRTDVLSTLLRVDAGGDRLSEEELRDQLVTLLLAGHETTATALAWTLYELGRSPELLARARTAARDGDSGYLEAAFKESMRLHPVLPMVVRHLRAPVTVGGHPLPAGATVGMSILLSHARPDSFARPETFDPYRFLGPEQPPANSWIPFGGGVRRCLGAGFAVMEGVSVLREVLTRHEFTATGVDHPVVRNITSVPAAGARIRLLPPG